MKDVIVNRYERDSQGRFIIDVAADGIEDLYHAYDKCAPYVRRDLDPELVDYLTDCARELDTRPYVIQFSLVRTVDNDSLQRISRSISVYFGYLAEKEISQARRMVRKSIILLILGIFILFLAVWFNQLLGTDRPVVVDVFAQGLTVAAWVSLWEAIATFLLEWFPLRKNLGRYRQLAGAKLIFRARPGPGKDDTVVNQSPGNIKTT